MPVRLVCPSCSATLSVKDEYAGRAVKCPKCGGVIPASQPADAPSKPSAALPPEPPPSKPSPALPAEPPAKSPFEALDEPAGADAPKVKGRPSGKPVAKAGDDYDDRPAKKRGRDDRDDYDDRPARKGARGADDDYDDRPRKRRRDADDGDDRPAKKKGGAGIWIVAILCGTLLTCCGGVGYAGYWFYNKAKKAKDDFVKAVEESNFRVRESTYNELDVGEITRTQAEGKLGAGKVATDAELDKVFASSVPADWKSKADAKRVVVWQDGANYIVAAFSPDASGTSRLQMKEWRPKSGAFLKDGELDDAKFLAAYPPGGGPGLPITAEELCREYNGPAADADARYKKKTLLVEGKLRELDYGYGDPAELRATFEGIPKTGGGSIYVRVNIAKSDVGKVLNLSRGQTVKLKGKCTGFSILYVELTGGTLDSSSPDPNPTVTASGLIGEFTKDAEAAGKKYDDKPLTITGATFERKDGDQSAIFSAGGPKKGTGLKIRLTVASDEDFKKQLNALRANSVVKIKGEYSTSDDKTININRGWIVP